MLTADALGPVVLLVGTTSPENVSDEIVWVSASLILGPRLVESLLADVEATSTISTSPIRCMSNACTRGAESWCAPARGLRVVAHTYLLHAELRFDVLQSFATLRFSAIRYVLATATLCNGHNGH